jgi:opacity protein-like surface antigen
MDRIRTRRWTPLAPLWGFWVGLWISGSTADARADAGEWALAVESGYELLDPTQEVGHTLSLALDAWFGVSEFVWLKAQVGVGHAFGVEALEATRWDAQAGGVFALDVLRWVPYLEVTGGGSGGPDSFRPSLGVGLGADYFLTENLILGPLVRYRYLADVSGNASVGAFLRFGYRGMW